MTTREYNAVAGRFMTVERGKDYVIVGLIGSLYKADLTRDQLHHIVNFCAKRPFYKYEWLTDYTAPINHSMYNNYLYVSTRNPMPDTFNRFQKEDFWRACEKIYRVQTCNEFRSLLRYDLSWYGEEVVSAAREYMRSEYDI